MKEGLLGKFAKHPVAANLLMMLMLVSGLWALTQINTQFLPNFDLNFITVTTVWPGANAQDVEKAITIPLESQLRDVDHLKKISSKSRLGISAITIEFKANTDMREALDQVKEEVISVRRLPQDSEKPIIKRIIRYEQVARIIITTKGHLDRLRPRIYKMQQELLDRGISRITISGLTKQMVAVKVPTYQLAALNLSLNDIATRISNQSVDLPAGTIGKDEGGKELKTSGQKKTVKQFLKIPLLHDGSGRLVKVNDIATVNRQEKDGEVKIFYHGQPAVQLEILRTENSSALKAANIMEKWLKETKSTLPQGVNMHVYAQSWTLILERINLLTSNGFQGLILVLIILFAFLHPRFAGWIAIGIPVSFAAAIAALYFLGGSINMVSMFAFIMTLGIIVDDTIVVGEQAYSELQAGTPLLTSVIHGAKKMLSPVLASSLTTICAFIPLFLISGIMGQILREIPIVTICVIIASVVECFLVLPGHLYHSLRRKPIEHVSKLRAFLNEAFVALREKIFRRSLVFCLRHRYVTLISAFGFFAIMVAIVITGRINFTFFPDPESTLLHASVQFTAGTPPEKVKQFLFSIEKSLYKTEKQLTKKDKTIIVASVAFQNQSGLRAANTNRGEEYASVNVELTSPDKRSIRNQSFMKAWKKNTPLMSGVEHYIITEPRPGPPGKDIDIEVSGASASQIKKASVDIADAIKKYPGVRNIADNLPFGKPHLIYYLKPQAHALGLTESSVGRQLRAAFSGVLAQVFHEPYEEVEVRVQLPDHERYHLSTLQKLPIKTEQGKTVPLSSVVTLKEIKGFDELRRVNSKSTVNVVADVDPNISNANKIIDSLKHSVIPEVIKKYNVSVQYAGRSEEQAETLNSMLYGMILALVLIYLVLSFIFKSYGWPVIIMLVIPLGLTGAIIGHLIMRIDLTVLSLFGFFGLTGIVINDSIILVNRYQFLRKDGMKRYDAVVEAACQRLRAVLLTSLTTIAGLTPLLFETSRQAQFLIPMAVSISFGLMYATVLILIVVPSLLLIYEQNVMKYIDYRRNRLRSRKNNRSTSA